MSYGRKRLKEKPKKKKYLLVLPDMTKEELEEARRRGAKIRRVVWGITPEERGKVYSVDGYRVRIKNPNKLKEFAKKWRGKETIEEAERRAEEARRKEEEYRKSLRERKTELENELKNLLNRAIKDNEKAIKLWKDIVNFAAYLGIMDEWQDALREAKSEQEKHLKLLRDTLSLVESKRY